MEINVKSLSINADNYDMLETNLASVVPSVKGTMGIINEAAHYVIMNAIHHIKKDNLYTFKTKKLFSKVVSEYNDYANKLLYKQPGESQFFSVEGLSEVARSHYKDNITDKEYFEEWIDIATSAQKGYQTFLEVLRYKYEKELKNEYGDKARLFSWLIIATVVTELAIKTYHDCITQAAADAGVTKSIMHKITFRFEMARVYDTWMDAALHLFPTMREFIETTLDDRNIRLGHEQLHQAIANEYITLQCFDEGIKDNAHLYRNKKALISELQSTEQYKEYMRENNIVV